MNYENCGHPVTEEGGCGICYEGGLLKRIGELKAQVAELTRENNALNQQVRVDADYLANEHANIAAWAARWKRLAKQVRDERVAARIRGDRLLHEHWQKEALRLGVELDEERSRHKLTREQLLGQLAGDDAYVDSLHEALQRTAIALRNELRYAPSGPTRDASQSTLDRAVQVLSRVYLRVGDVEEKKP